MSNTKYALRANHFGYNDEFYYIDDGSKNGRAYGTYDSREEAMAAWKKMEYQTVKNQPLGSVLQGRIEGFSSLPEEELQALDTFVFERCGEHIVNDDYLDEECETTIAKMNVEDVFEFLTQAELCSYTLVEYQPHEKFYVWWFPQEEVYIFSEDDSGETSLCQASSVEELYSNYDYYLESYLDEQGEGEYYTFTGALEELSESPEILRTLIATNPKIEYDEEQQVLSLKDSDVFKLVYPLLINPPVEVREVTLEQIIEIEKKQA